MAARTSKAIAPKTLTASEIPVTRAMLGSVRTEVLQRIDQAREEAKAGTEKLDAKVDAVKAELKADIHQLDAKIDAVRAELKADIHQLDAKVDAVRAELKADIHEVKVELHEVKAVMHGMQAQMGSIELLVEEQNNRNKIVLDGITALFDRQNQVEQRVSQVEDTVRKLASARATAKQS